MHCDEIFYWYNPPCDRLVDTLLEAADRKDSLDLLDPGGH